MSVREVQEGHQEGEEGEVMTLAVIGLAVSALVGGIGIGMLCAWAFYRRPR